MMLQSDGGNRRMEDLSLTSHLNVLLQPSAALLAELHRTKTLSGSVTLHRPGRELLFDQKKHNLAMQKF